MSVYPTHVGGTNNPNLELIVKCIYVDTTLMVVGNWLNMTLNWVYLYFNKPPFLNVVL